MTRKKDGRQVNRRMYECQDCHAKRMVPWVELNRAARPKCYGCGSTRLELVSDEAKADQSRLQRERVAGTGGNLILSNTEENTPHRKVT